MVVYKVIKRAFDLIATVILLLILIVPMIIMALLVKAIKRAFFILVRSGGGGQRDFQDAEIQDDADRYAGCCNPPVIESR